MPKIAKKSQKRSFVKDYNRILKSVARPIAPLQVSNPQWGSQGDYFVKFSLYKDTPSIASIVDMEDDNELQDLILTVHHSFMHTFSQSMAVKVVENHLGIAFVESMQMQFSPQNP